MSNFWRRGWSEGGRIRCERRTTLTRQETTGTRTDGQDIRTEELPGHNNRQTIIGRFRCGNKEEVNKYWVKEGDEECVTGEECVVVMEDIETLLGEDGLGLTWMKEVLRRRKEIKDKDLQDESKKML
jgi:hypothetical protein